MINAERQEQPREDTRPDQNSPAASDVAEPQQDDPSQTDAFEEEGAGLAAKE